jgi:hypothetical protein
MVGAGGRGVSVGKRKRMLGWMVGVDGGMDGGDGQWGWMGGGMVGTAVQQAEQSCCH